jgi:hypothetical protein
MTVIVVGPMACGKTRNAEALRKHFKCNRVVDSWDGVTYLPRNSLALTTEEPLVTKGVTILQFRDACRQAGIPIKGR